MRVLELATLTIEVTKLAEAPAGIAAWAGIGEARGTLLGCFLSDLGAQNRVLVLRGFEAEADLAQERDRALHSSNPFGCGAVLAGLSMETYRPFDFLPPIEPGTFGPVYEFRSYMMKPGALAETLRGWAEKVPARVKLSPLLTAMYALDGPPRFTHVWCYPDLNTRAAVRAEAIRNDLWPPRSGGPHTLMPAMAAEIYRPAEVSPLQ